VLAQGRPGSVRRPASAAPALTHIVEAYSKLGPFDADRSGQLEAAEKELLAMAIVEGQIEAPAHRTPPPGVVPDADMVLAGLAAMYARLAPYDADQDGALSESERATLTSDIENGKLRRPGGARGGRPRG
jgi:hypothetical protein